MGGKMGIVVNVTLGLSAPRVLERNDFFLGTRMNAGTAVLTTNRFRLRKENQTFGSLDSGRGLRQGCTILSPPVGQPRTCWATKYYNESPTLLC